MERARKYRIIRNGHPFLDEAREALETSFLSDFCKTQVIFELKKELLSRREGVADFEEIAIDHVFTNPRIALDIEISFLNSISSTIISRRKEGRENPVNIEEWQMDIKKRLDEQKH